MIKYDNKNHEPCKPPPHNGQEEITINGFTFHADKQMIPLLEALNAAGVQTYSHCAGHEQGNCAWVVLELECLHIEVRPQTVNRGAQAILRWTPPWSSSDTPESHSDSDVKSKEPQNPSNNL